MSVFCQLWLTCADEAEADAISHILLEKKLVACVKQLPVSADFQWQDKIENGKEILLVMDSRKDLFDEVETEVARLHSYDIFVLQAIPITKISKKAEDWLNKSFKG
jgi:periplasmic divalent cation tolerance protein